MDVPLNSVSATVEGKIDLCGFVGVGDVKVGMSDVSVGIKLDAPDASDEQLDALKGAVDAHCPLVATIANPLLLTTVVVKKAPSASKDETGRGPSLKEGVMGIVAAATEDNECLRMTYSSTSKLAGAGLMSDVTLPGGHTMIVDEVRFLPGGVPTQLRNRLPLLAHLLSPFCQYLHSPSPSHHSTQPLTMPGGSNKGPNPLDLFCASFGTCQEITYKYYADVLGIDCQSVSCKVVAPIDLGGLVGVDMSAVALKQMTGTITIESDASDAEIATLKGAVDAHCPLVDTLKSATPVALTWSRA
tara:strand:+ start:756 stop:1658 length:903 start_codon:yes stop_codon:yes gene_type:complete